MKRIVSRILLSFFAAGLVSATLFLDEKLIAASQKPSSELVTVAFSGEGAKFERKEDFFVIESGPAAPTTLVFRENALARFSPKSSAKLQISEDKKGPRKAILELTSGRVWLNTIHSTLDFEIKTAAVKVEAPIGIFDIEYDNSNLTLKSIRHAISPEFLGNRLIIPEGREMTVSESKVSAAGETIAKLRYSKLFKEFPFNNLSEPDNWRSENEAADEKFFANYEKKILNEIRSNGPALGSDDESLPFKFKKLIDKASLTLTFDPSKKEKKQIENLMNYFDSAVFAMLIGKEELAKNRLTQFSTLHSELAPELRGSETLKSEIALQLDRFAFIGPRDTLAPAKSAIRSVVGGSPLALLQTAFDDVLDLAASGVDSETNEKVVTSLRRYGALVNSHVKRIRDPSESQNVFFQSVILNDFLSRNPHLLREEFLKISSLFESAHLNLIASREEADDERQFFIAEKLRSIQTLKILMERDVIPFQDARRSILLLANEIDALKPTFSDAAVLAYFEDQLKTLQPTIAYLRSPQADRVRGGFQEDFEDFKTRQDEIKEVTDLLAAASGGTQISASRREELAGIVASDFGPLGISEIKIILPESEDDSRVKVVSAELEGTSFTATYDTARKVLSDLAISEEKIPSAIRLENFKKFFLIRLGKLVLPVGETAEALTEAPSTQTVLEKVAKTKLIEELTKLKITVEEKYLGLENLKDDVIHVRLALLGTGSDAKVFSFDVAQKASVVSNLKVQTVSGELPVNDTFALRELPVKVEQIYERAVFEKQKEEELKKFVEGEEVE